MHPIAFAASALAMLALQAVPDSDARPPAFVRRAVEVLSVDRVLGVIDRWPRRFVTPELCQVLRVDLPNSQAGSSDGLQTTLWADLERETLWVEIVRGLDGRSEYRGPVRITESGRFRVARKGTMPDCRIEPTGDPDGGDEPIEEDDTPRLEIERR